MNRVWARTKYKGDTDSIPIGSIRIQGLCNTISKVRVYPSAPVVAYKVLPFSPNGLTKGVKSKPANHC